MMPRCLPKPCPLSLSILLPYAVVSGSGPLCWVYDAAASGTAVPALPPFSAATRCCARVRSLGLMLEVDRGVECRMPRRVARPCPLLLYSRPAHAVVWWYVLGLRKITSTKGRGAEL